MLAATAINMDITIRGVSKPNPLIGISKIFKPTREPTNTGPSMVPMLFAAPNLPIPEDLSSSVVTSAT